MNALRPRAPDVVMCSGLLAFVVSLLGSAVLFRDAVAARGEAIRYSRILAAADGELGRLARYEANARRAEAAPSSAFSESRVGGLVPAGVPAPGGRSFRRTAAAGGFEGLRAEWTWDSLDKKEAFRLLAAIQGKEDGLWRVAGMRMDALPDGGRVSLRLLLESAVPRKGDAGE